MQCLPNLRQAANLVGDKVEENLAAGHWKFVQLSRAQVEAIARSWALGEDGPNYQTIIVHGAGNNAWYIVFEYKLPDSTNRAYEQLVAKMKKQLSKLLGVRTHDDETFINNVSGWRISKDVTLIK